MTRRRILPKPQTLHQKFERDCGVCVFARLAGISEDQLRAELPDAQLGKVSVDEWHKWLEGKGLVVTRRDGCSDDAVPCAHLVSHGANTPEDFHWVWSEFLDDLCDGFAAKATLAESGYGFAFEWLGRRYSALRFVRIRSVQKGLQ
jgi:hypothetical protein